MENPISSRKDESMLRQSLAELILRMTRYVPGDRPKIQDVHKKLEQIIGEFQHVDPCYDYTCIHNIFSSILNIYLLMLIAFKVEITIIMLYGVLLIIINPQGFNSKIYEQNICFVLSINPRQYGCLLVQSSNQ